MRIVTRLRPADLRAALGTFRAGAALALWGAILAAPAAHAQPAVLWEFAGAGVDEKLGRAVAGVGDLDDDGYDDVAVGVPGALGSTGRVIIYSGKDGGDLYTFDGLSAGALFGTSVANAGDVDEDGVNDVIAGAPSFAGASAPPGYVRVFSGADGSVLHTITEAPGHFRFGNSVAGVGDVDGDGRSDFLVGAPGTQGIAAGYARLYSGADGSVLFQEFGTPTANFGHSVAATGDVDGDGVPDFVVGSPGHDLNQQKSNVGQVRFYSGATLTATRTLTGKKPSYNLGWSVAGAGDVNGDGRRDLIMGGIGAAPGKKTAAGQVVIYSGKNFKKLGTIKGPAAEGFMGSAVAGAGDLDGDGRGDMIVGASGSNSYGGLVLVVAGGPKPKVLFTFVGAPGEVFGDAVAGAGDVDGDGSPDFIIGGWSASPGSVFHAGRAVVYGY